MPTIPFDSNSHQKVRYSGKQYVRHNKKLFVVNLRDYEFDKLRDEEFVIIHPCDKHGIVTFNKSDTTQPIFVARKSELTKVGAEVKE